jgi:hypothetical protein
MTLFIPHRDIEIGLHLSPFLQNQNHTKDDIQTDRSYDALPGDSPSSVHGRRSDITVLLLPMLNLVRGHQMHKAHTDGKRVSLNPVSNPLL